MVWAVSVVPQGTVKVLLVATPQFGALKLTPPLSEMPVVALSETTQALAEALAVAPIWP